MGAGRKTKTLPLKEKPPPYWTVNCSASARNLRKSDLGGVIFGCKHNTRKECLSRQLFGLPAPHFAYVQNISPGLPLFLFNYSDRMLHGVFEAASPGRLNINPYGWTTNGTDPTPYAAQVQVHFRGQCKALHEDNFGPVIADNYYEPSLFWFELDRTQSRKLIELFENKGVPPSIPRLQNTVWNTPDTIQANAHAEKPLSQVDFGQSNQVNQQSGSWDAPPFGGKTENSDNWGPPQSSMLTVPDSEQYEEIVDLKSSCSYSSAPRGVGDLFPQGSSFQTLHAADTREEDECSKTKSIASDWNLSNSDESYVERGSLHVTPHFYGESQALEDPTDDDAKEICDDPLNSEICSEDNQTNDTDHEIRSEDNQTNDTCHLFSAARVHVEEISSLVAAMAMGTESFDRQSVVAQLMLEIEGLKGSQLRQMQKISSLEQDLVQSNLEIQRWKNQCNVFECGPFPSSGHESLIEPHPEIDVSVLIVGGFDGSAWLPALCSYSLSHDRMKSLSPMTFVGPYASAAKLNGELYTFGGGHGDVWYDTVTVEFYMFLVESYDLTRNQWVSQPPLNQKKGHLAGASLYDKIFAIGGGNGVECFSNVEMFGLNSGRWIFTQAMHQKRFAPAAAEINGALYVVGGYNGRDYLK
ncbi:unnamed protein product [Ilex paraguariensis]